MMCEPQLNTTDATETTELSHSPELPDTPMMATLYVKDGALVNAWIEGFGWVFEEVAVEDADPLVVHMTGDTLATTERLKSLSENGIPSIVITPRTNFARHQARPRSSASSSALYVVTPQHNLHQERSLPCWFYRDRTASGS